MNARSLLAVLACAALVGWFWTRGERFMAANGPTFDEPVHLAAGYSYWSTGSFKLNREDPPLLKLLWAAPLALRGDVNYPHDVANETNNDHWHIGNALLFHSDRNPRELLTPARRVNLALGCGVMLLAGWCAFRLWGSRVAGVGACAFAATDPNLLALSCVLSTDAGLTFFTLLSCYLVWEYAVAPSRGLLVGAGVALGLALGTKFSALAVVLGLGAAGCVYVLRGGRLALPSPLAGEGGGASPPGEGAWSNADHAKPNSDAVPTPHPAGEAPATLSRKGRGQDLARGRALAEFAFRLGLIALVTLAATYGFVHFDQWGSGLKFQLTRADHGDGRLYLNGELSRTGWYHYFFVLLPLKLPLGLIAGVALVTVTGRLARVPRLALFVVPAVVFFALASYSRVNLGVRVVLPVLPFLYVLAAGLGAGMCCRAAGRILLALCVGWAGISATRNDPYPLSYFNEPAGGSRGGARFVADSNLDWGQGLPALKNYLDANGGDAIYLSYFGTDRPEAYGIRYQALPTYGRVGEPGGEAIPENAARHVLVISVNNLLGIYLNDPETFAWLRTRAPDAILAGGLYVFDLTTDADAIQRLRAIPTK